MNYILSYPLTSLLVLVIWVVCLIPVPETPLDDVSMIDKWTHFAMYGVLTLVVWWEYRRNHSIVEWRRLLVGGVMCPALMGVVVELAQAYLTTCRSGDVLDAVSNGIGVLLGTVIGMLMLKREKK